MPIYQLTGKDGKIYRIEGPAGLSKEVVQAAILKKAPQAGVAKEKASAIENIPVVGGVLAPVADIPLALAEGLGGTAKTFTDLFGAGNAASDFIDDATRMARDLRSAGSREDEAAARRIQAEAEGKGIWEEVKAAARAFTYSPLETTASVAGSALPFIAAGVATGGTGLLPAASMAGLGVASGAGSIKGEIYDSVYEEFRAAGASEEDASAAAERAQEYGGKNMDQIALGGAFGALASATGFSRQIAGTLGKRAAQRVAERAAMREATEVGARRSTLGGAARGMVEEAVPEALQAGQEQFAGNVALQREGFDVDAWKGVAGQAAFEGIASLLLGGIGGARETRAENRDLLVKELAQEFDAMPPDAGEEQIDAAAARFMQRGIPPEKAQQIAKKLASEKLAIEERAAELSKAREEAMAARTAGVEMPAGPDISAPPPVDTEEQAAMQRMREAEITGAAPIEEPTVRGAKQPPKTANEFKAQRDAEMDAASKRSFEAINAALAARGLPPVGPPPVEPPPSAGGKQPATVTPARAEGILKSQAAVSDFAATTGMDTAEAEAVLYDIANEVPGAPTLKYSRRGRPPSASTLEEAGQEGLFGALPEDQRERLSKREEVAQYQLEQRGKTEEQLEAERQARADEFTALQEQAKERNEQYKTEFVERISEAVRRANPANEAYSVQVDEASPKPYKIVGPDGELFVAADNLQEFEEQAMELVPYTPPPLSAQQMDEDTLQPTVATSMVQELTKEIDTARQRGEIDNNQRAELLGQLERPDSYDRFNRPQDNIAKAEADARKAMGKFRNATGLEAKAAEAELVAANEKLTKLVNNRLLNPVRSKLRSMSENRQLEREGATSRIESARVQKRLGEMEGKQTAAEQREIREAGIDIAESKVSKYRRGEPKQPGGPPKIISAARVQAVVDAVTKNWKSKNPVVVLESIMDIRDPKLRSAIEQDNAFDANGFVAPDGTIYLVADNLLSEEDAKAVLFHEALGHTGLEKLFRNNLDQALVAMYRGNAKLKADTDKWRQDNPGAYERDANPLARAIEEVLAERSESGQLERNFFQKIAAIIRNFARRMGINLKISDGDVAAILSMAHDKVVKGDAESTIVKGLRYITAWHGSPYDFDTFTTEKIGTGEGHAAYGWGLYFASERAVGEHYRNQEAGKRITIDGQSMAKGKGRRFIEYGGDFTPSERRALQFLRNSGTLEYTLERLRRRGSRFYTAEENAAAKDMTATLIKLRDDGRLGTTGGSLYEVELIPDNDEYLDWKEPISEQSAKVQEALASLDIVTDDGPYPLTGADAYNQLRRRLGSKKEASLALLGAGIRGNKYPDGLSRGVGVEKPAYNYVIFADEDVQLTAKYSRPKTTKKTAEELQDTEADMSVGLRRMEKTSSTYAASEGLGESIKGRKLDPFVNGFKENYTGMKPAALKATLAVMPTSGILNWFSTDIPRLKEVDDLIQRMVAMKANILKASEPIAQALQEFLVIDENKQLARSMGINRINEMSPDEFQSAADALANHPAMQELEKRILKNSNDKKLAKQVVEDIKALVMADKSARAFKGDKTKMTDELKALVTKLDKTAVDVKEVALQQKQLVELSRRIRDTYREWDKLGELEGGHELYKQIRSFYRDMFEAELALLDARIERMTDEKSAKRLRDLRADMMREAMDPKEAQKAGDLFASFDASLFSKDYFPFMREGLYWLRVKPAADGTREREFYTFQTAKEMQTAQKAVAKRLGVHHEDSEVIAIGNDISTLQENLESEDLIMGKIFALVGEAKSKFEQSGAVSQKDFLSLTDSIYQTWLMTTPERSVRRRFMHAEEVVGQQLDLLQQFSTQATNYANQLSKMAFAGDVRLALSAAKDSLEGRPATERAKLETVVNEFDLRAESEINPDPQSALVNMLNRASYFYYLTSASTALLQVTSIPIRVVPRLWRDYGFAKGTAMWVKYMQIWKSLGQAKTEKINTGIGDQLHAMMPNIMSSKIVNNGSERSKLLKRALEAGMERNILETVQDTLVQNEREVAKQTKTGASRVASNVAAETGKIMGVMFQGMENITRQAAYFMSFELAYDDYKAKNPQAPEKEVFDAAVATALDTVRDTLGDYTNWERSRLMKGNWTRAVFLFKMHPIVQTKFMVGAFRDIIRGFYPGASPEMKAARAGAFKELMGVTMMAGMFGGLMAMPLYTPLAWALAEGFDDEDDEDVRKLMGMDPRVAYDSDIMFRAWLMDTFGTPKLGDVPLADILIHGPLAAFTDTELSSRVSMDLKNMWFREAVAGDSTGETMVNTALANIAPGQMLIQMLNAKDNFADGDIAGGLRKLAPAFFRSWIAGAQGEIEGIETRKGDMIIPKEDITAFDTARTLLGFRPMTLARWQDYYITRGKNDKKIEAEKSSILGKLDRMIREGDIKTGDDLRAFWKEEVEPFNRTYPDPALVITPESMVRSLKGREDVRERTLKGMQLDRKTAVKDYEAAKAFMPE